jgi:hypothetical protein
MQTSPTVYLMWRKSFLGVCNHFSVRFKSFPHDLWHLTKPFNFLVASPAEFTGTSYANWSRTTRDGECLEASYGSELWRWPNDPNKKFKNNLPSVSIHSSPFSLFTHWICCVVVPVQDHTVYLPTCFCHALETIKIGHQPFRHSLRRVVFDVDCCPELV